ncbi:MAG: diguanylate cyclase [Synechococcales cyanobacterium T60_A2020_003]|nr:diguanylate cyclase [Synechococcales cyanobacterium T60_A2020_003]
MERMLHSWQRAFEAKTFWQDEYRFLHRDGTVIWVMARCVFTFDDRGENTGSVGSLTDITRQKEIELELELANQELERLANLDGLTEVANRRYFDQFLDQEWLRLRRSQHPLSLLMIDIDCFKAYNDTYGHVQGDQILKTVAQLLDGVIRRPTDLVARYGGEEFVIVLPDTDAAGANHLADEILREIHGLAIPHQGSSVKDFLTLSIGLGSQVPAMERSPDDLILQADQALYLAKIQGRDRVVTNP